MFAHLRRATHLLLGFHQIEATVRQERAGPDTELQARQSAPHLNEASPGNTFCWTQQVPPERELFHSGAPTAASDNMRQKKKSFCFFVFVFVFFSVSKGVGNKCQRASASQGKRKITRTVLHMPHRSLRSHSVTGICCNLDGPLTCLECCTFRFMK